MNKRTRITIVLSLLFLAGAIRFGSPLFMNSEAKTLESSSTFNIAMSYEKTVRERPLTHVADYQDVEQGSFFIEDNNDEGFILSPLLDTQVELTVTGLVARAEVTQTFTNPSQEWVNGIYVFPLPENAAVDHLSMFIGDRIIQGQVQPKATAKAIYEQAKQEGRKASLLTQSRPNLFTNSVANIGPGESIKVVIEYQQAVHFEDDTFSLTFPTTLTQRYLPADAQANHDSPGSQRNKVAIEVKLDAGFPLSEISSAHHALNKQETTPDVYRISLQESMTANQDFTLNWKSEATSLPTLAHFVEDIGDTHYGMVLLMPPSESGTQDAVKREVIFVIDTSGSMHGESIQQAQKALALAIDKLAPDDVFNVIEFNSTAASLWAMPQQASRINKGNAVSFIDSLDAEGGTEMMSALQLALGRQQTGEEKLRQVIFITDGAIGNEAALFSYIHENLQQSRLFTVGIGSAPNRFFMTEAAMMGKGTYTFVDTKEDVASQMQALFDKLTHPVLTDIALDLPEQAEIFPYPLPDLYKGQPLTISYKAYTPIDNMLVSGERQDKQWHQTVSLNKGSEQSGLNVLWARRKIAQLERNKYKGSDPMATDEKILRVAMQHHLVSSMTSLVAVDITPTALAFSEDRQVKNLMPLGQSAGRLPQTATPATLYLFIAIVFMGFALCRITFTKSR